MSKDSRNYKKLFILSLVLFMIPTSISVYLFLLQPKIGYVHNGRILSEYLGVKEGKKMYEDKAAALIANLDTLESEIKLMIDQYKADFKTLTNKEKILTEELISKKQNDYLGYKKAVEQKIKEEDQDLTSTVLKQIDSFIIEYAKKNRYDYIFGTSDAGSLFFAADKYDITDVVLEGLNENYKGK